MYECEWPKGCPLDIFAYVLENDEEFGYCDYHLIEWLSLLPYRDEIEDVSFVLADTQVRHYRFEWTVLQEQAIEHILSLSTCPDCGGKYSPPMSADHKRFCTGRDQI